MEGQEARRDAPPFEEHVEAWRLAKRSSGQCSEDEGSADLRRLCTRAGRSRNGEERDGERSG
jgi:hypothetical protein